MQSALASKQYSYERHKPEETVLYKLIQENLASFLEQFNEETGCCLPDFVIKEFDEYLRCGILAQLRDPQNERDRGALG